MSRFQMRTLAVVGALALSFGLVACGSDGGSSASGGKTLTFGVPCQISGPQVSPECADAVKAYFKQVNAQGGVQGYKLAVKTCDTQTDPTRGANCLKEFESDSSIIGIVASSGTSSAIPKDLAAIGSNTQGPGDDTNPNMFPISGNTFGGLGDYKTGVKYAESHGATKPAILSCTIAACSGINDALKDVYQTQGTDLKVVSASLTTVNLQPQATVLKAGDYNPVFVAQGSAGNIGFMKAAQSLDYKPIIVFAYNCFDQNVLREVPTGLTVLCSTPFNVAPDKLAEYKRAMDKQVGAGKYNTSVHGVNAWVAAHLAVDDLKGITGTPTRAKVLEGMSKITNFTSPLLAAPIDFSKPGPVADHPSVRYWYWYPNLVVDRKVQPAAEAVDTSTIGE